MAAVPLGSVSAMSEIEILSFNHKKIRKELDESQIDFAANCGISVEELSLLERGRSDPKMSTLQKIAAYTGKTVSELLTEDGDMVYTF